MYIKDQPMELKLTFDVPNNLIVCVRDFFLFTSTKKHLESHTITGIIYPYTMLIFFFFFCVFCFPMHLHSMSIFIVIKSMTNPFVFLNYKINAKLHCVCHFRCKCKIAFVRTIPSDFIIPEILER